MKQTYWNVFYDRVRYSTIVDIRQFRDGAKNMYINKHV